VNAEDTYVTRAFHQVTNINSEKVSEKISTQIRRMRFITFQKRVHRWVATTAVNCLRMNDMSEHAAATERRTTTVEEARQMHPAVGRGRLYAALKEGQIRSAKVGKRIAIDVADLDSWVMAGAPVETREKESGP